MIPKCIKNKQLENRVKELENNKILNRRKADWVNTYTVHYDYTTVPKIVFLSWGGKYMMVYAIYFSSVIELGGNVTDSTKCEITIDYANKDITFKLSDGGIMYVVDFPNI